MFSDADFETVNIPSSWKQEKSKEDRSSQTPATLTVSRECSPTHKSDVTCQTDQPEPPPGMAEDTNPEATLAFLKRVEPEVTKILKQNQLSHAFDDYNVTWRSTEKKTEPLFTLEQSPPPDSEPDMPVTSLAWSAKGNVIAVGYGRLDHQDLCWHKSFISTWNLDRHSAGEVKPDESVVVENCVISLAFHPERATLLAGGLFNGNIYVWDLSASDEQRIASTMLVYTGHTDPVNQIEWVESATKSRLKNYNLLSVGGEGLMIIWELDTVKGTLDPIFTCTLTTSCIPKSIRVSKGRPQDALGITCAALSREDPKVYLVGTESGNVFKCSLHGVPMGKNEKVVSENVVTMAYTPHVGPVYSVCSSPFHRNLFLTCGIDATLCLFSMLDRNPVLVIDAESLHYILSAEWSYVRPTVFTCTNSIGEILIFDLSHSRLKPVQKLTANSKQSPVNVVRFNKSRRQLMASGDRGGSVVVWELSSDLCNLKPNEQKVLERIATETPDLDY